MTFVYLMLAGVVAWIVSTLSGGGGALLLIPIITLVIGSKAVPPIIALSSLFGSPSRAWLMREDIKWEIVRWYLPGAIIGAALGAYLFTQTTAEWVQIFIGLFLISSIFQYRFGKREQSFGVARWYFLPAGFLVSFLSGLIGGMGPVLNPLYLNYGALKEEMIGTKSFNSSIMHLTKIGTYTTFGALPTEFILYGVAVGIAAILGGWLGKRFLSDLKETRFRQFVIAIMVISGLLMLWEQRSYWLFDLLSYWR